MGIFSSLVTENMNMGVQPPPNVLMAEQRALLDIASSDKEDHPDFWHLSALVCEAVLEVVCVSSLGFIAAKKGLFSAKVQKDMAALNIYFFTPCLIFSKLAAQLTGEKLTELWIIPVILFVQTIISWLAAEGTSRIMKLNKKPQRNFVTAMAVFGNSNSLPLSLVLSLSHTISGLHWDKVPNDNDKEVGARGILYLLVFSQLGQAVRWSWGMNTLLRPLEDYTPAERGEIPRDEEHTAPYKDDEEDDASTASLSASSSSQDSTASPTPRNNNSGTQTPNNGEHVAVTSGNDRLKPQDEAPRQRSGNKGSSANSESGEQDEPQSTSLSRVDSTENVVTRTIKSRLLDAKDAIVRGSRAAGRRTAEAARKTFCSLPQPFQKVLRVIYFWAYLTITRFMGCINVPLAAIILSVLVGSVPDLKAFFYTKGTFVNNTITTAINQLAGVAVPLILFVLGGNLCKSTLPDEGDDSRQYRSEKRRMLWCAIVSRMVIPLALMAPFLALLARFTPISILDDPIFIIVCFLLTGAPSALQLAQICQVNDVFVPVISQLLVHSYVVWIFPSTLVLVLLALVVVRWADAA